MSENKDFFDEEYEKKTAEQQQSPNSQNFDSWYSRPAQAQSQPKNRKPLYIALICIGVVVCLGLGWLLGIVVDYFDTSVDNVGGHLMGDLIAYLQQYYYEDIDDETMWPAIEEAGTAFLQAAGDRYCQLMSPDTYYEYKNGGIGSSSGSVLTFGVDLYFAQGIGLYIGDVYTDSNAYGWAEEGDYVYALSDITHYDNNDEYSFDFPADGELSLGNLSFDDLQAVASLLKSATFHALRDGKVVSYPMVKGIYTRLGEYHYIEYYFYNNANDTVDTNLSLVKRGNARYSSVEARGLADTPHDTGYVRITQFMGEDDKYNDDGTLKKLGDNAYNEFVDVMNKFKQLGLKHLVLDLKGNPGGRVDYVIKIAGLLVTEANLIETDQNRVVSYNRKNEKQLLITTLEDRLGGTDKYAVTSTYDDYFATPNGNIVVWTDGNSASASELLTGALLDYGTAEQMGTTTFGKGIAQGIIELPYYKKIVSRNADGSYVTEKVHWAMYFTFAKYFSPLGINIHKVGYNPQDAYDGLTTYEQLWQAAKTYWGFN